MSQCGSLVDPKYLRFDFGHHKALSKHQLREVENRVNQVTHQSTARIHCEDSQAIAAELKVDTSLSSLDDALKAGAIADFQDKYDENGDLHSSDDQG